MFEEAHIFECKLYPDAKYNPDDFIPTSSADIIPDLISWCNANHHQYAYILHDLDNCKPHIHFLVRCNGNISLDKIRREYHISKQNVYTRDNFEEAFLYLCHRSKNSINDVTKHKYMFNEIQSNFDFSYIVNGAINENNNEIDVIIHIIDYALENHCSYYELLSYVGEIGAWKIYKRNFNMIDKTIQHSKSNYLTYRKHENI